MSNQICKIVYFDEESVTDYVQIVAGGEMESTTELLKSRYALGEQTGSLNGKAGISGIFKALTGWGVSAEGTISENLSFNSNKLVKNIVKNTILTDFLQILDEEKTKTIASKTNKGAIKKFEGYSLSVEKDSLSYMVMVSPYLSMIKTNSSMSAGEFDIAIDKFESTLKSAKGYYEFVGTKNNSKVVLRFNINSFRNGYTIADLLKMDLAVYAIKVGRTSIKMLDVNKELDMNVSFIPKDNPSYEFGDKDSIAASSDRMLDVFDVLLAGVESYD